MSIQSEITKVRNTKTNLRTAIMEKGVVVSPDDLFSTYPTRISQISTESGTYDESLKKLLDGSYTSYAIPDGTEKLKHSAFHSYTSLVSITIPPSLKSIGQSAFKNCTYLSSVLISDLSAWCKINFTVNYGDSTSNPLKLAKRLYLNGTLIKDLVIPSNVTEISAYAFSVDTALTSLVIPDNVTTIGEDAFSNCSGLKTVEIGTGITNIGGAAFQWCTKLTSITIKAETPPGISSGSFSSTNNCPIYVPRKSLKAYRTATNWSNYADRIQAIDVNDFNDIIQRTISGDYELPSGTTTIGNYAFARCTELTSVTIPSGVTSIGVKSFAKCTGLESVTIEATTPPSTNATVFHDTNDFIIYVPAGSVDSYKTHYEWKRYADRIQAIPS